MLILVEGTDCSGKSTLIKRFQDICHLNVFKNPIKPTAGLQERGFVNGTYFGAYNSAKLLRDDLIFDRSHITELVYAKIKRGYEPEKDFWNKWEEENSHYVVVVYVTASLDVLKERMKARGEDYISEEESVLITEAYDEYIKTSKLSTIFVDGTVSPQRMVTQLVIQLQNLGFWSSTRYR